MSSPPASKHPFPTKRVVVFAALAVAVVLLAVVAVLAQLQRRSILRTQTLQTTQAIPTQPDADTIVPPNIPGEFPADSPDSDEVWTVIKNLFENPEGFSESSLSEHQRSLAQWWGALETLARFRSAFVATLVEVARTSSSLESSVPIP